VKQPITPRSPEPHEVPTDYEWGLISIIILAYNRERLIVEALESVFAQTYRPIEMVVVDGKSTNSTAGVFRQIAEQWKAESGRQLGIFEQLHKGGIARGFALRESRVDFIQFLDSDT